MCIGATRQKSETLLSVREFTVKKSSRSNSIGINFLKLAIPAIWERAQRTVKTGKSKGKIQKINGVVHVDGNIVLADLEPHMDDAILGKLKLLYTGPDSLSGSLATFYVERILKNSKGLYKVSGIDLANFARGLSSRTFQIPFFKKIELIY